MLKSHNLFYAALVTAGGFGGGLVAMHFAPGEALAARQQNLRVLTAEQFNLVDENGNKRASLQVSPHGWADLMMLDEQGNDRAEFRVARDGTSSLGFWDIKGVRRVLVGASSGRNGVAIFNSAGRQLATLSAAPDNQVSLTLYDANSGKARAGLGVAASGEPALVMFDQQGRDRVEVQVGANGNPGVALADENGKSIAGLPTGATAPSQK